jgi:uncharacterized membrane protein
MLHPFVVHVPIGLLLGSVLFTVLFLRRGESSWETSAFHCMLVGWFGSVAAVVTGLIDAARHFTGPDAIRDPAVLMWVNAHAAAGIGALVVFGQAVLRRRRKPTILSDPHMRRGYLGLLVLGTLLLLLSGWLGGQLVYRLRIGIQL